MKRIKTLGQRKRWKRFLLIKAGCQSSSMTLQQVRNGECVKKADGVMAF